MSFALYLWGGSITLLTLVLPVKLAIGNMHYRGIKFGGAHVWKTSPLQAMEFFRTQNFGPGTLELCTQHFPEWDTNIPNWDYFTIFSPKTA